MEKQQIQVLVVDTNSWHYNYFCRIRRHFGISSAPDQTSLCAYVQTMIWLSVVFVLSLPLQIIGWLSLKSIRGVYRLFENYNMGWINDIIDDSTLGVCLVDSDKRLEKSPWLETIGWAIGVILLISCVAIFATAVSFLVVYGIQAIPLLPSIVFELLVFLGWVVVFVTGTLSSVVCQAVSALFMGLLWFFTTWWLWELIIQYTLIALLSILSCVLIAWAAVYLASLNAFKSCLSWLSMRLNGYKEANQKARERREGQEIAPRRFSFLDRLRQVRDQIYYFFTSKVVVVEDITFKIMSPMAIAFYFLWALKKRACPVVKFTSPEAKVNDEEVEGDTNSDESPEAETEAEAEVEEVEKGTENQEPEREVDK